MEHIQDLKYNDVNYSWLKNVPEAITKQVIKDLDKAYKLFFKSGFGKPKFKKKNKCKVSFYQRTDNFRQVDNTHIKITGIQSYVKIKNCEIPQKVCNTRVRFDGKYWYLSYTCDVQEQRKTGTDTIGIDLGIKDLAIVSNKDVYRNINKTQTVSVYMLFFPVVRPLTLPLFYHFCRERYATICHFTPSGVYYPGRLTS